MKKSLERKLQKAFGSEFMQAEITEKKSWHSVNDGEELYPADYVSEEEAVAGRDVEVETVEGYGARLSAPGYLDSTDWAVFDTEDEAAEYLLEMYADE